MCPFLCSCCCQLCQCVGLVHACVGLVHASTVLLQLAAWKVQYFLDTAMGLKGVLDVIGLQTLNSRLSLLTSTESDRDAVTASCYASCAR